MAVRTTLHGLLLKRGVQRLRDIPHSLRGIKISSGGIFEKSRPVYRSVMLKRKSLVEADGHATKTVGWAVF